MTAPDGYRLVDVATWAFMAEWTDDDRAIYHGVVPRARARAAEVADATRGTVGALAGVYSAYDAEIAVPGGAPGAPRRVRCAGLTWVGVHPSHRRRGIMRSMVEDHFAASARDGYPISALGAAETEIYQRFGYGLAARQATVTLERKAALRPVTGSDGLTVRIERADIDAHLETVLGVMGADARPGTVVPPAPEGHRALFSDPEDEREDHEKWRIAIVEDAGVAAGFAFFRRKEAWTAKGKPVGTVQVHLHHAHTPAAAHRVWTTLLDLDLTTEVSAWPLALDDPLLSLLADPRGAQEAVRDNLWLRVLDVKGALEGRGYAADGEFCIVVTDDVVPANNAAWRVAITGGAASVRRSERDSAPDLRMGIQELSAAYLGGVSVTALAAAGLVEEDTTGAAELLSRAMASPMAPMNSWEF